MKALIDGDIHIDHVIPKSHFNIISAECEDFKKCWALSNLQPLLAKDNLRKNNKLNWSKENQTQTA